MIAYYVDLDIYTQGHAGSVEDPFSWDDFISNVLASVSRNYYYIKGSKEFDTVGFKDIVSYLNVDVTSNTITVANDYPTGTPILFVSNDPPEPIENNTVYWVIRVNSTTIKLALSYSNAISNTAIDLLTEGTESHNIYQLIVYWPSLGIMHNYFGWDKETNGPWRLNFVSGSYSFISLQGFLSDSIMYFPDEDGHVFCFNNVNVFTSNLKLSRKVFYLSNTNTSGCNIILPTDNNLAIMDNAIANFYDSVIVGKFLKGDTGSTEVSTVNCVTTAVDYNSFKNDIDILLTAKVQYGWIAPLWPNWYDSQNYWSSEVLGTGISIPPNPGILPYYGYDTGLYGEDRLGIGSFYFVEPQPTDITESYTNSKVIVVTQPQIKKSNSITCIGWIKSPSVEDGDILIPLAVADPYGRVINTDTAIKFEILREGLDYRLQYLGSKSKLIDKTLKIKIDDNNWHMLSYESDVDGNMVFYVDALKLKSEDGLDQYGLPYSVAKSFYSRVGGGKVWSPYIYKQKQIIYLYNWRFGKGFNLGLDWIKKLMEVDRTHLAS